MQPLRSTRLTLLTRAVVLLFLALATKIEAQYAELPAPGTRIRADLLTAEASRMRRLSTQALTGTLVGRVGDTLLVAVRPTLDPVRIPQSSLRAIFVTQGRPGRLEAAARRAFWPAVLTGALAGITASVAGRADGPSPGRAALNRAGRAILVAGALGAAFPQERWRKVWQGGGRRETQAHDSTVADASEPRGIR